MRSAGFQPSKEEIGGQDARAPRVLEHRLPIRLLSVKRTLCLKQVSMAASTGKMQLVANHSVKE